MKNILLNNSTPLGLFWKVGIILHTPHADIHI